MDWNAVRADFSVAKKYVYLANAATTPIPKQVHNAVLDFYNELRNKGDAPWEKWMERKR